MSQEPQQVLPYEIPAVPEKPACILPISIVGISLGSLTILMRLIGLAGAIVMAVMPNSMRGTPGMPTFTPAYQAFQIGSAAVFAGFGAFLLIASIGTLKMKEWGRAWLVRYAFIYPIALVMEIIATAIVMVPAMNQMMSSMSTAGSPSPPAMKSVMAGAMIGSLVIQMIVLMILPVFIFVLLRKPEVKTAFRS